jgi:hypothetical protein
LEKGFTPLANPIARRTIARAISVRQAAAHHGLDAETLVAELNAAAFADRARGQEPSGRSVVVSLPVVS